MAHGRGAGRGCAGHCQGIGAGGCSGVIGRPSATGHGQSQQHSRREHHERRATTHCGLPPSPEGRRPSGKEQCEEQPHLRPTPRRRGRKTPASRRSGRRRDGVDEDRDVLRRAAGIERAGINRASRIGRRTCTSEVYGLSQTSQSAHRQNDAHGLPGRSRNCGGGSRGDGQRKILARAAEAHRLRVARSLVGVVGNGDSAGQGAARLGRKGHVDRAVGARRHATGAIVGLGETGTKPGTDVPRFKRPRMPL